ncbi:hypothetical protein ZYGR_0EB00100, partial [Zygosaccharomyces rouxii]
MKSSLVTFSILLLSLLKIKKATTEKILGFIMIRSLYSLLLTVAPFVIAFSGSTITSTSPSPIHLARRDEIQVQDIHDACYGRSFVNSVSAFAQEMEVHDITYLGNNVYDVTIHVFGQISLAANLFQSLAITNINGPESELTVYSTDSACLLESLIPTDYIVTFQSYGVPKGDDIWLPRFQLEYTYGNDLPGVLASATKYSLTAGCVAEDSFLSGYYWRNPELPAHSTTSGGSLSTGTSNTATGSSIQSSTSSAVSYSSSVPNDNTQSTSSASASSIFTSSVVTSSDISSGSSPVPTSSTFSSSAMISSGGSSSPSSTPSTSVTSSGGSSGP